MSYRDCLKLLISLSKCENEIQRKFLQCIHVVSEAKLARLDVVLMPEPDEKKAYLFIKRKGKRFSARREIRLEDCADLFIDLEDIWKTKCNCFTVFSGHENRRRPTGVLFKIAGRREFLFLSFERQIQFAKFLYALLIDRIKDTPLKSKPTLLRLLEEYQP